MFAKPFVGQLGNGHRDGIYTISKNFKALNKLATGSADGIIKYWDLSTSTELASFKAHYGQVTGTAVNHEGKLLSAGDDKTVKLWSVNSDDYTDLDETKVTKKGLLKTYLGEHAFQSLDHHYSDNLFVTGGAEIQLWNESRSRPVSNLSWGADNISKVRFNKTETSILASAGSDNSVVLYDIRTNTPTQKLVQTMRTNAIEWNPMEAFNFVTASEDHNLYYYDMRYMKKAMNVFKDHVAAVLDVDFSPTGEEIVSGSYDKTIRIFKTKEGHSRDIYHTKRMQHVFQVKFSMDSKYIVSGSDDGNVRLWRSNASKNSGVKSSKERSKLEYDEALKERFRHMPEIKRISRHRHVPGVVKKAKEIKNIEIQSLKKRQENERRHSKPGSKPYKSEREKQIVNTAFKTDESKN
ncbi:putative WD repeat-containing protein [Wickerhamomyces ciferrii]|uniref:WD repeat-containing protein n=1 Tax=Wickerhamomyces ciferrii (strain ATCC 14091 / BCRC 22168 / CBS 111 / JCM 3599 / NBRC 0793 / NRRL Y-1031 F-60-10) TaxID=1206466 RepID=K0KPP2_WICCF|nr:putative WD repeat-containing protein [Wickerhamomyces ciferrii]CCH43133.1 putative WD repeat-containing protein [Wickerhamomyces ciferrii]